MKKLLWLIMLLSFSMLVCAWPGTQITTDAETHNEPESAPGMNTIVYTCNGYTCTDVRGGGNETIISSTSSTYHPDINSQGEIVYGQWNGSGNFIFQYISGVESQLNSGLNTSYGMDMCPDNDTVAYYRRAGDGRYHIFKILLSTNTSTQLTSGSTFNDGEGINADGIMDCGNTHIVFSRCTFPFNTCDIAKVPIAGGAVTNLTTDDGTNSFESPQWNVNYTSVVFTGNWNPTGGNVTVFTVNADGTGFANITTGRSNYWWPFTCPNSTYAVRRDASFNYYISQVQPSIIDDLDNASYDYPSCDSVTSFDIFYSKSDGSNNQIYQQHFGDGGGGSGGQVPEFSTITLLLAAMIALGGIFAFRRFR